MKFPAVAIAICFTSGIAMGLWPMAANRASSRGFYFGQLAAAFLLIAAPLHRHGILRDEPATLPWGTSYEIELTSVAYQQRSVSIQGSLRASYTPHGRTAGSARTTRGRS